MKYGIIHTMADPTPNPFRAASGSRYTKQLFLELSQELSIECRTKEPMYTLMHERRGLPCFRHIYVALADPTGYELAVRYLEDYNHWEQLMKCTWFREAKEVWDRELDAKLTSEGMKVIRFLAEGNETTPVATQLTAAKYLADKAFRKIVKEAPKRGRPTKEEVAGNLTVETQSAREIADDLARIRKA